MTPGCQAAPGVFCFWWSTSCVELFDIADWSALEDFVDRHIWSYRHAGPLWLAGSGAGPHWRNLSLRHVAREPDRLLFSGLDCAVHHEPHGYFSGLACSDRRRIFWRLHNFFELWMGNRENDGRRRMAARLDLRSRERGRWIVSVSGGHSAG